MTDHEKTSRDYLEAWRTSQAEMQRLRDALDAERERVRVLREAVIAMCDDLLMRAEHDNEGIKVVRCGAIVWRKLKDALATTEPESL